jgi:hypothetical protein
VEGSHRVDSRRPCAGVDIRDTVGIRGRVGTPPCAGAFRKALPRIHEAGADIPEAG